MPRTLALLATLVIIIGSSAEAQLVVSDTQGLSTVPGTGARALGMGGAYTAVADDVTAAVWNPAGLALLDRPEVMAVGDWYEGDRVFEAEWVGTFDPDRQCGTPDPTNPNPVTTGCREKQHHDGNSALDDRAFAFFGGVYPFELGEMRLVGALSFRRVAAFPTVDRTLIVETRNYGADDGILPGRTIDTRVDDDNFTGGVDAYSASLASAWGKVRVGLTVSWVDADMDQRYVVRETYFETATHPQETLLNGKYQFSDVQFDLGLQWQALDTVTFGLVYHSGFETELDSKERRDLECDGDVWGPACGVPSELRHEASLEWPDGWTVGAKWQPTSRWVVAVDYGQTEWSEARVRGRQFPSWDENGNPIVVDLGTVAYPFAQEQVDTWAARIGAEYTLSYLTAQIPLRLGYIREQQAALSTDFTRDEFPPDPPSHQGVTVGVGVIYEALQLDLAWVHMEGEHDYPITVVTEDDLFRVSQRTDFSSDHFLASLSYKF